MLQKLVIPWQTFEQWPSPYRTWRNCSDLVHRRTSAGPPHWLERPGGRIRTKSRPASAAVHRSVGRRCHRRRRSKPEEGRRQRPIAPSCWYRRTVLQHWKEKGVAVYGTGNGNNGEIHWRGGWEGKKGERWKNTEDKGKTGRKRVKYVQSGKEYYCNSDYYTVESWKKRREPGTNGEGNEREVGSSMARHLCCQLSWGGLWVLLRDTSASRNTSGVFSDLLEPTQRQEASFLKGP